MAATERHGPAGSGREYGLRTSGARTWATWHWLLGLTIALAGCQAAPSASLPPPEPVHHAGLPAVPPCPSGLVATLSSGTRVAFIGADPDDPDLCLRRINGHVFRYRLGFWGGGRATPGTPEEREALRKVLTGPVGTEVEFPLPRHAAWSIWESASVAHIGDPSLALAPGESRRTILLRVVRRGPPDRPGVQAETRWWLDWTTGIPLKQQEVVRMAHGTERETAWEVRSLDPTPD